MKDKQSAVADGSTFAGVTDCHRSVTTDCNLPRKLRLRSSGQLAGMWAFKLLHIFKARVGVLRHCSPSFARDACKHRHVLGALPGPLQEHAAAQHVDQYEPSREEDCLRSSSTLLAKSPSSNG